MLKSEKLAELAAALSKAQGEIKGAKKDADNPYFKSKYADLSSVWDACRDALSANGLSVLQAARSIEGGVEVETLLMHASGEWVSETLALPVQKADAQGFGSALTYCRRYGLSAMIGIAPEDDDGNAAAKAASTDFKPQSKAAPTAGVLEQLPIERQKIVNHQASRVVDAFTAGDAKLAHAHYETAKSVLDTDEQVALRGLLPSDLKTALRKMAEAEKIESIKKMESKA